MHKNQEALDVGRELPSRWARRNAAASLKTKSLLDALAEGDFTVYGGVYGRGATRKSPLAPRNGSTPSGDSFGQWDPKNQRPELWNIFNSRLNKGESIRVFPLSNWTASGRVVLTSTWKKFRSYRCGFAERAQRGDSRRLDRGGVR